jgi:hypothetical protein
MPPIALRIYQVSCAETETGANLRVQISNTVTDCVWRAVIRGHENYLENNAQMLFALLVNWIVLKNYSTCFVFGCAWALLRVFYAVGYSISPSARGPFFALSFLVSESVRAC